MYYCGSFADKADEYTRKGFAKKVRVLPGGREVLCDVQYNSEENVIDIVSGNRVVILTDKIGIREDTEFEFLPVTNGILVILDAGCCYVNIKDMVVCVNANGDVFPAEEIAITGTKKKLKENRIYWVDNESLRQLVMYKLNALYSVPIKCNCSDRWYYNSVFKCVSSYTYIKEAATFSFNCTHAIAALGVENLPMYEASEPYRMTLSSSVSTTPISYKEEDDDYDEELDDYDEENEEPEELNNFDNIDYDEDDYED